MVASRLMGSLLGLWVWKPSSSWPCCACRGTVKQGRQARLLFSLSFPFSMVSEPLLLLQTDFRCLSHSRKEFNCGTPTLLHESLAGSEVRQCQ